MTYAVQIEGEIVTITRHIPVCDSCERPAEEVVFIQFRGPAKRANAVANALNILPELEKLKNVLSEDKSAAPKRQRAHAQRLVQSIIEGLTE